MENDTKQTLTKDDHFSLYIYLDRFVHQLFGVFFCLFGRAGSQLWCTGSPIFVGAYGIFAAQGI